MNETIIHTRTFGDLVFSLRGPYVYLSGKQVCKGGRFNGDTLMSSPETLDRDVSAWWSAHRRVCGCQSHGLACDGMRLALR